MSSILDPNNVVADYVLQVSIVFRPKTNNRLGSFNIWKKGGWFGKADELIKFCAANGCLGHMSDTFIMSDSEAEAVSELPEERQGSPSFWPAALKNKYDNWHLMPTVCPECGNIEIRERLPDSYGFNMSPDRIAGRMVQFFYRLQGSADVYMVRTKNDKLFHKAREMLNEVDTKFSQYQKTLERARERDCVFYSLKSIMKDTANGSDVALRFKSLLEA